MSAIVKIAGKNIGAGYLMLRQDLVRDLTTVGTNSEAVVGIDFGSNNTCMYYNTPNRGTNPIVFGNYRAVLVGREIIIQKQLPRITNYYFHELSI